MKKQTKKRIIESIKNIWLIRFIKFYWNMTFKQQLKNTKHKEKIKYN